MEVFWFVLMRLVRYMREEESFAFMEEDIMESKKPKRQLVAGIKRVILYGLIFGTVAGSTFSIVSIFMSDLLDNKEIEKIALSTTVEPEATDTPEKTKEPTGNPTIVEENKTQDIQNIYDLIGKKGKKINRSLVEISSIQKEGEDGNPLIRDSVSGVIVARTQKYVMILTKYNSIKNMQQIRVTFMNYSTAMGNLYNYDSRTNLAIVKVPVQDITETTLKNLVVTDFGESRYLEQGDLVYVAGQPDGVINSIEFGYITRESYTWNMEDYQVELYGTSLGIHNNGYGMVFDMQGNCLGILDEKYNQEDVTAFVGINELRFILENLLNQKKQVYVGIIGRGITEEYLEQFNHQKGLYVTEVIVDSPAYEAGIQVGDVIRMIDGEKANDMVEFFELIQKHKPKETLEFSIIRENSKGKKELNLYVKLRERK